MIALLAAVALNVPSFIGAGDLAKLCDNDRVACGYYIAGASDALSFTVAFKVSRPITCPASTVNLDNQITVVSTYLRKNAASLSGSAFGVIATALGDAYPCPK